MDYDEVQVVLERQRQSLDITAGAVSGAAIHAVNRYMSGWGNADTPRFTSAGLAALEFGRKNGWPPAEAFARAAVFGTPWDKDRWEVDCFYRLGVTLAVGVLQAFDREAEALGKVQAITAQLPVAVKTDEGVQAGVDESDLDWAEGEVRKIVDAPAPEVADTPSAAVSTPLSAVHGIGDRLEARLHAVGIASVEALSLMRIAKDERWAEIREADQDLHDRMLNDLVGKARAHLTAGDPPQQPDA